MSEKKENIVKIIFRRILILEKFIWSGLRIIVFKPYWHDKYVTPTLFVCLLINLLNWFYLMINKMTGDYPIILHYNLFFGVDFLGDYSMVYVLPIIGFFIFLINTTLGHFLYKSERLAAYIVTVNIFIVQCFLFLASYLIIKVNS